jgi:DNA-binding Lrp family transcriptional regulator
MMGAVAMDSIAGGPVELDDFDRRLLDALQADNRRTGEELADIVGLSPAACLRRAQRLRDEKSSNATSRSSRRKRSDGA